MVEEIIISEFVQCPECGEKDYILLIENEYAICLSCGYDGSMVNWWILLFLPTYYTLYVEPSVAAGDSDTFSFHTDIDDNEFRYSHNYDYPYGATATLTITHNYNAPPAFIAVSLDGINYDTFMLNEHDTLVLTYLMDRSYTLIIKLQEELPPQ